jgi:hypothetical protein
MTACDPKVLQEGHRRKNSSAKYPRPGRDAFGSLVMLRGSEHQQRWRNLYARPATLNEALALSPMQLSVMQRNVLPLYRALNPKLQLGFTRMPRFWLRWAFEHLQMFTSVTPGTPGDAQLGTYLPDADFMVSADRNFLRISEKLRPYAPCKIALTKLVAAGKEAVEETVAFLSGG